MKKIYFFITFFIFSNSIFISSQNNLIPPKDILNQYNQKIKEGNNKINFSENEIQFFDNPTPNLATPITQNSTSLLPPDVNCSIEWQDAIFGTCIGRNNSLIPYDFDNDGTTELITNASSSGFGDQGYWYILKYNSTTAGYDKIYVSALFEDDIDKLTLADIDDSGDMELLIGEASRLHIVDLENFQTLTTIEFSGIGSWEGIAQIKLGDGDNDSVKEIMVSGPDNLYFVNPITLELEQTFNIVGGDFDFGNVDSDSQLEIVFTNGTTLEIDNANAIEEYDFRPNFDNTSGFIELSDIDNDGFLEAIAADSWYKIGLFDVELEALKFEIDSDLDIDAFMMLDITNDGEEEILYGDGQWGNIYCHDASSGALLWEINNPEHGTTGIAVADFDNDQNLEVVWGAGCSSTGSDYLFFHNVSNLNYEWQSTHVDGPFYGLEIEDVDQDGTDEIITLSFESESGYDGGILTVYDATTKNIEFQSDGNFFGNVWTGMYNLEIADYQSDGDLDIIIAAGDTYDGKFWIVDGNTFNIEAEHEYGFQENISEFRALDVNDIDDDGTLEFIAANSSNLYIINSLTFEVEWESNDFTGFNIPSEILIGNIDNDPENEIILCNDFIYTYDHSTFAQSSSATSGLTAMRLFDWDNSGDLEILAGSEDGFFYVLEGNTLEVLETFALSSESIGGIEIADLNDDGEPEFVVTAGGQIIYLRSNGEFISSQTLGDGLGKFDGIVVKDYDGDGEPNIVLGDRYRVLEVNPACANCLWFEPILMSEDPKCGEPNGNIFSPNPNSTISYTWNNNTFTDSLSGLDAGTFQVIATNDDGCSDEFTLTLQQQILSANISQQDKTCFGQDDGWVAASIQNGAPPFNFSWSNNSINDTISNLAAGTYTLTLTDANGCSFLETIEINQSELVTELQNIKPTCVDDANGAASINVLVGVFPFNFAWDNVSGINSINSLGSGDHVVTITDDIGCVSFHNFFIDSTSLEIMTNQLSASCNGENDGSANVMVNVGTPPYNYNWSNGLGATDLVNNITSGTYTVTITDGNDCMASDTVMINESVLTLQSSVTELDCFGDNDGSAVVFVTEGIPPYSYQWNNGITDNSISGLGTGNFFVLVQDSVGCTVVEQVQITSPPAFELDFTITNDDDATNDFDGAIEVNVTGGTAPYFFNWDNGGTTEIIENLEAGEYYLLVTDINECKIDSIVTVNLSTKITELQNDIFEIYPNPTTDYLIVDNIKNNVSIKNFQLYSSDGKLISLEINQATNGRYNFNLSKVPSGQYILLAEIDSEYYYKKIVVQK